MSFISYFPSAPLNSELPETIPSPFANNPHPLAKKAGDLLQANLASQLDWQHDFDAPDGGKMFGVLVVKDTENRMGYLSAFSGMLAGQWQLAGFVPPVFDLAERETFLPGGEAKLAEYGQQIKVLNESAERAEVQSQFARLSQQCEAALTDLKKLHKNRKAQRREQRQQLSTEAADAQKVLAKLAYESQQDKRRWKEVNAEWNERISELNEKLSQIDRQITSLKKIRAKLSNKLHKQVFATYRLTNKLGEQKSITELFEEGLPPGGAGDCAAPKLIHYAIQNGLEPLALAEFWWGASPKEGVRHHGHYYPACRGKCRPILPFMFKGYALQPPPALGACIDAKEPVAVYEDDDLVVVNKPHGLLSVPGKEVEDSVLTRLQKRYPQATGPLLVHRLDMSTSGLLLVAKNSATHKALQNQFLKRTIEKRYVAVLSKPLPQDQNEGMIELPLRVDLDDRPRQLVCFVHGKKAKTRWRVIAREEGQTRVYFYPITGRTHQLRLHASHKDGLNAPIKGDELYGDNDVRLKLHAERLSFTHPNTGKRVQVIAPAPF